ncbi:hypothetical protein ACFWAA_00870 [Streptomyces sp. NPDC059922]|uniref:hypothetical protein n=1 Tax=Streptomyces sp. NPDC059922 TaxID=3347005 RepID=UPI003660A861
MVDQHHCRVVRGDRRKPDPVDRRAKLIHPTERGLLQMEAAASIMRSIEERHARALGEQEYKAFKAALQRVAALRQESGHGGQGTGAGPAGPSCEAG